MDELLEILLERAVSTGDKAQAYRHTFTEYVGRTEYLDIPPQQELPRQYAIKDCLSCLSSLCDTLAELCRHLSDLRDPRQFMPQHLPHAVGLHAPSFLGRVQALHTVSDSCRSLLDRFAGLHQHLVSLSHPALPPEMGGMSECISTLCAAVDHFVVQAEHICRLYEECEQEIAGLTDSL